MKKLLLIGILINVTMVVAQDFSGAQDYAAPLPSDIQQKIQVYGYEKAVPDLERYISKNPRSYDGLSALGKAKAIQGDLLTSLKYLVQAKDIKESADILDSGIYNSLGWVKFLNGDSEGAKQDIMKAIENQQVLDPEVGEAAYNNLGIIYLHSNDTQNTELYFNKARVLYNSKYAGENLKLLNVLEANRISVYGNEPNPMEKNMGSALENRK